MMWELLRFKDTILSSTNIPNNRIIRKLLHEPTILSTGIWYIIHWDNLIEIVFYRIYYSTSLITWFTQFSKAIWAFSPARQE